MGKSPTTGGQGAGDPVAASEPAGAAAAQRVTVAANGATITTSGPVTLTAGAAAPPDPAAEFKLELYKYFLGQIHFLNDSLHKYLTLFQTLATGILTAGVAVFVGWRKLDITPETARLAVHSLMGLLGLLALFVTASIVAGIFSWFDYRNDEVKLLGHVGGDEFRHAPEFGRNVLRWYETQAILFIIVFTAAAITCVEVRVVPLIQPTPK